MGEQVSKLVNEPIWKGKLKLSTFLTAFMNLNTFWDILGHFGTFLDILGHFGTIQKTF